MCSGQGDVLGGHGAAGDAAGAGTHGLSEAELHRVPGTHAHTQTLTSASRGTGGGGRHHPQPTPLSLA